jgi:hypothetical protein
MSQFGLFGDLEPVAPRKGLKTGQSHRKNIIEGETIMAEPPIPLHAPVSGTESPAAPAAIVNTVPVDPMSLLPARVPAWDALLRRMGDLEICIYATALWTGTCLEVAEDRSRGTFMLMKEGQILKSTGHVREQSRRIFLLPRAVIAMAQRTPLEIVGSPGTHFCHLRFAKGATAPGVYQVLESIAEAGPAPPGVM